MTINFWQPEAPLDCVIFDCDGTLSSIEGIDQLADNHGSGDRVKELTAEAMGKSGINPVIYKKRLDLVNPNRENINILADCYIQNCVPDTFDVIQLLKRLNKSIYIVSAGLYPAVARFGEYLTIPPENIFAVNITFDSFGNFIDYDYSSPLTQNAGKRIVVSELKKMHSRIAYVGDGLNDLVTKDLVTRFIGFGGIYYRKNIEDQSPYYIKAGSMSALLPLVLTKSEYVTLTSPEKNIYAKGLAEIPAGNVTIHKGS